MKQLELTKDPWFSQYDDWNLDWIRTIDPDTGTISKEDFDIWWNEHWKKLFGDANEVFGGGGDEYTGEVQEIGKDDDFTDQNYIYVKIEVPPKERDYFGSKAVRYNKMVQDNVKALLKDRERRPSCQFPISAGRVDFDKVEQRLELYIWKTKLGLGDQLTEKQTNDLTAKVSYLSGSVAYKSKRKNIQRDMEKLNKTLENIKAGTFP